MAVSINGYIETPDITKWPQNNLKYRCKRSQKYWNWENYWNKIAGINRIQRLKTQYNFLSNRERLSTETLEVTQLL